MSATRPPSQIETAKKETLEMSAGDAADPRWFRQVLGQYPTGVCVVTAREPEGEHVGMVVGSFTSVSLDPPLIAFLPDKQSRTWKRIERSGSFCVNILSADQEDLCRRFASRIDDKFAGVEFREAESGSAVMSGAVAWIDCDIDFVHEAGDHFIVLGRVRALNIENPTLPLLFFQGGYGRFAPLSLAVGNSRGTLTENLRHVDLVRPEMEHIVAEIPDAVCTAVTMDGDEMVYTATAGGVNANTMGTLVGQRLSFMPPLGVAFVAWMDDAALEKWLSHVPEGPARDAERTRVAAVRERGFSVSARSDSLSAFTSTLDQLAANPGAVDRDQVHTRIRELAHEPVEVSDELKMALGTISVPVFAADNSVSVVLTVRRFPLPATTEEADRWIECVRGAGERATAALSGHRA
jgi:flavin reductase (DIM6/NTAB) family NADH-FMN oxidoreductase RutF